MKLNTVNLLVGLVIAVSGVFYLGTYIVDKTQYAIEIRLGDAVDTVTDPDSNSKYPSLPEFFMWKTGFRILTQIQVQFLPRTKRR